MCLFCGFIFLTLIPGVLNWGIEVLIWVIFMYSSLLTYLHVYVDTVVEGETGG